MLRLSCRCASIDCVPSQLPPSLCHHSAGVNVNEMFTTDLATTPVHVAGMGFIGEPGLPTSA